MSDPIECSQCDYVADSIDANTDLHALLERHMERHHLNPYPTRDAIRGAAAVDPSFRAGAEAVLTQIEDLRDEWLCEPAGTALLHHQAAARLMHILRGCRSGE